ncbi:acyl-CoA ligase (AMP-forming), exosortase A system-associated [Paucibacter sp. XJ19-41]|uniref:acyl-CoA ligase (AMP-forming), exosortase A system-associated n=1 Tax=Paucibacter sp. XJ19-41 TaxID=2927824 RepID=UPI0023499B72|nr:acyl-CoA ligase (AMP-forming), exosortase A system-associated [Paucibacter sp. XJ19-41]MDC6167148.1 acyl-CoA ligase (AMP-forming), exosortase A system-associated [Paucibacter sp. XJ19-41]
MRNITDIVRLSALRAPADLALVAGAERLSYLELWCLVTGASQAFVDLGVEPGDRVAVWLDKRVETVVAMLAAAHMGAVFVPLNPQLKPDQACHILKDSEASLLVTTNLRAAQLGELLKQQHSLLTVMLVDNNPAARPDLGQTVVGWLELMARALRTEDVPAVILDDDIAAILYTSGSTGRPKGVVLSHRNLIEGARSVVEYLGNGPHDRILSVLPLSFDAGLSQVTTAFFSGARVVLHNYLLAKDVVSVCESEGITGITGVPALWHQLAGADWPHGVGAPLRYFANTGGHMPRGLLQRLREAFPAARPFLMYGLTEAFRSTYLDPSELDRRPESIGKAIPNARILVLRPDGTECGPDEVGELVHLGAHVAQGYWKRQDLTEHRFRPFHDPAAPGLRPRTAVWSGDLVRRDAEGFLYFVERGDSMIKTSGYRVSPTEIEEVVLASEGVLEAVAVGEAHPELGQQIVVYVVGQEGCKLPTVLEHCRRKLPQYMVPARFIAMKSLPLNGNGKYDRNLLAAQLRPEAASKTIDGDRP